MSESTNRIKKEHDLKIWSRHFEAVLSGRKKAEHRVNDRDFQEGDTLLLREVTEPECQYTGRKIYVTITHIIRGGEMDILSIEPQDTVRPSEISVVEYTPAGIPVKCINKIDTLDSRSVHHAFELALAHMPNDGHRRWVEQVYTDIVTPFLSGQDAKHGG